jgi:hypothetical protein
MISSPGNAGDPRRGPNDAQQLQSRGRTKRGWRVVALDALMSGESPGRKRRSISAVTRRAAIGNLGAFGLLSFDAVGRALADPAVRFREIRVDVWPLRASAGDPTADWVEKELPGHLTRALSAYLAPAERNGATLVARIQDVNFGQSGGRGGATGASQDSIQGVLIVGGLRAGIAAQTPLRAMAAYSPNATDEALIEEAYHGRVVALAQAFAGRVPGELGL